MATVLGTSPSGYKKWEQGKRQPSGAARSSASWSASRKLCCGPYLRRMARAAKRALHPFTCGASLSETAWARS
nr:hypothetical protein [Mesorhizobium alhagi]